MICHPERTEAPDARFLRVGVGTEVPRGYLQTHKILRFTSFRAGQQRWTALLLFFSTIAATSAAFAKQQKISNCQSAQQSSRECSNAEPTMPGVKRGSIDDVNAVGDRRIGSRGLGNWYSINTEIGWGNQIAQQVLKSSKIIHDPVIDEYVNRIGQNVVKNSDAKVPFTIKVIDTDEINAFALPGGYFFVNSGLILAAANEAQLAGVMAHEIAHVAAHHQAREMTRMHYADMGMVPLVMMTGYSVAGYGIYEASSFAVPLTFLQYQRDFEEQADWLGVQYMYRAGYDPQQLIAFFQKIEALQKTKPRLISKTFSSHPQTPGRVERTEREIATILPPRPEYVVDTSEFHAIQARLTRMENRRPLQNGEHPSEPSLRRVGATVQPQKPPAGDDDRPRLHP